MWESDNIKINLCINNQKYTLMQIHTQKSAESIKIKRTDEMKLNIVQKD